jgi:hypothetical protein
MGIVAGGDDIGFDRVKQRSNITRLAHLIEDCCCRISVPCCRHWDHGLQLTEDQTSFATSSCCLEVEIGGQNSRYDLV